jgi:hopanoid biosynthesis associated protein HpnK
MPSHGLIITADDFGADEAVNQAVEMGHRRGVLTAASLMVGAPAAADAVARARALPTLAVGLHLVLVEGRPVLPAAHVSRLVDGRGLFREDMVAAGASMAFDPLARRQLEAEIAAQFAAFAATGLPLDHVNAHKHFHLHPTIAGLILKIGARHGLRSIRVPVEPAGVLRAVEPGMTAGVVSPLNLMAGALRRRCRRAGLRAPDAVFGLRWSGAMTAARLRGLIDHLPAGLNEIYLHPATLDAYPGSAPGYRYREELAALTSDEVAEAIARSNIPRGGFETLAPPTWARRSTRASTL